jgi:hypothetical protein
MEHKEYEKEIKRLESELNHFDSKASTIDSGPIQTRKIGLVSYLPYLLISAIMFGLLFIVKPKCILKIVITDQTPQMAIDKGKLIIWWLLLSITGSICYVVWKKFKHRSEA